MNRTAPSTAISVLGFCARQIMAQTLDTDSDGDMVMVASSLCRTWVCKICLGYFIGHTVVAATATTTQGFDEGAITGSTNRGLYLRATADRRGHLKCRRIRAWRLAQASISATDVVYNAAAGQFFAAIRYHGVYSSTNGQIWTRLANQPNPTQLSTVNCPRADSKRRIECPIYRGQLAVVPGRNEMYFWFVRSPGEMA